MLRRVTIAVVAVFLTMLVSVPGLVAAARDVEGAARSVLLRAIASTSSIGPGSDGRLTVLLLGSDFRPSLSGERIDVILVASFDPNKDKIAAASIPRDTIGFPRHPDNRTGGLGKTSGSARVNTMYKTYKKSGCSQGCALGKFTKDVAYALDLQIDYYAYIQFPAFDALVDEIGGVTVDAPGKIVDKSYMDEPTLPRGIWFEDDPTLDLHGLGTPHCLSWKSASPACHRAIVYVRSRKGTEGSHNNSDYRRAYRQQSVVTAAVQRVTGGEGGPALQGLVDAVVAQAGTQDLKRGGKRFITNMKSGAQPTLGDAAYLYDLLQGATLGPKVVFAPSKYATASGSTIKLKLAAVRAWVDTRMSVAGP